MPKNHAPMSNIRARGTVRESRAAVVSALATAVALCCLLFTLAWPAVAEASAVTYSGLRGVDRYDTAFKISKAMFPEGLPDGCGVVLAPGETFPEALCGAPLAAAYGGPVLLTPFVSINSGVVAELLRLGPEYVFCIGLSDTVAGQVQTAMGPGVVVTSIAGDGGDIYDLSYRVAKVLADKVGDLSGATAIITRGDVFPDAISVSPLACAKKWPVLLTAGPTGDLHPSAAAALSELGIGKALKVGTYAVLPDWVTGVGNLSGVDRYGTNRNVAEWGKANAGLAFTHMGMATGDKFPDALAAGPYLAKDQGILLLSPLLGPLPATIRAEIVANDPAIAHTTFIAMIRPVTTQVKTLLCDLVFDATQAMGHVWQLAVEIGPRRGGTADELAAVQYGSAYFQSLGYEVSVTDVPIPNGLTSHNVIAVKPGSSPLTIVVGGHMDSKVSSTAASPGGNDNASGAASVLELARAVKDTDFIPTLVFVLFGNEEG
ncbi:MAG: cell wall-binding repeat-containing protein, partial [Thermoleophilia bacterium]|nr:cell wall-binding repeat-containing protein [Thermoleophilia bacterium]